MTLRESFDSLPSGKLMIEPGIFCDCLGTLFNAEGEPNQSLIDYLNAEHAAKTTVIIFSDHPRGMRDKVRTLGLHPALTREISSKRDYDGVCLEVLIDDQPPSYLKARKRWHPEDSTFKQFLKDAAAARAPAPGPSP